jgi:hypothetical protein
MGSRLASRMGHIEMAGPEVVGSWEAGFAGIKAVYAMSMMVFWACGDGLTWWPGNGSLLSRSAGFGHK